MTTISKSVGRGDVLLHRGSNERVGVKWEEYNYSTWKPVDLTSWWATFSLEWRGQTVYTQTCVVTSNGLAYAEIPSNAFIADKWRSQSDGSWKIIAQNGERTEILAWGNYTIQ